MAKYFKIQSRLNGMYLDVPGCSQDPGTRVCMWSENDGDNQLWYEDKFRHTIRSKCNGFSLDFDGERLTVNPSDPDNPLQGWCIEGDKIVTFIDPGRCVDVADNCTDEGAQLTIWDFNGGDNQLFDFPSSGDDWFFIKSRLSGMVLDIDGGNTDPGAKVIQWDQKDNPGSRDNQLWRYDWETNCIKTKLNDFCLDIDGDDIILNPFDGSPSQIWVPSDDRITNLETGKDLDLADCCRDAGGKICCWDYNGGDNQKWDFEFVDE